MKRKKFLILVPILIVIIIIISVIIYLNNSQGEILVSQQPFGTNEEVLSEEEQLWNDSKENSIYKLNIQLVKDDIYFKILKNDYLTSLRALSSTNKFANKYLTLYDKTNIEQIYSTGNEMELFLLYCIEKLEILSNNKIEKIYYSNIQYDDNQNMIVNEKNFTASYMIFQLTSETETFYQDVFGTGTSNGSIVLTTKNYKFDTMDEAINGLNKFCGSTDKFSSNNIVEIDKQMIDNIFSNENIEFLKLYQKYREIYKNEREQEKITKELNKPKEPAIGMTKEQILNSTWGSPNKKNVTENAYGTHEQWVYDKGRYIYFDNGIVTSIQKSE